MKILVVSDTHGIVLESIFGALAGGKDIDVIIHCGDKYNDVEKLSKLVGVKDFFRVVGNCDYDIKNGANLLDFEIENKRILVTHGHLQNVKDGLDNLKSLAKEKCTDIVLFGHTHISHNELENNILYFNPGSPILPKGGKASYGIVEISKDKISSKIVNL